jgi:hypothetical protein
MLRLVQLAAGMFGLLWNAAEPASQKQNFFLDYGTPVPACSRRAWRPDALHLRVCSQPTSAASFGLLLVCATPPRTR